MDFTDAAWLCTPTTAKPASPGLLPLEPLLFSCIVYFIYLFHIFIFHLYIPCIIYPLDPCYCHVCYYCCLTTNKQHHDKVYSDQNAVQLTRDVACAWQGVCVKAWLILRFLRNSMHATTVMRPYTTEPRDIGHAIVSCGLSRHYGTIDEGTTERVVTITDVICALLRWAADIEGQKTLELNGQQTPN